MKRILFLLAAVFVLLAGCAPQSEANVAISPSKQTSATTSTPSYKEYPDTPEEVWGKLEQHEGGRVWGTLTPAQQALVNYPKFDKNKVYWTKSGKSYHAIDWCYTLETSHNIMSGTLEQAKAAGKTDPCSKCVGQ
ncbi:hypothetical protein IZU99_02790 [Oscillospiraceae bacterium CM]|nr:hypothetical protein IZU99_02790 [Oscillospiraceae bacterium CM]